MKYLSNIDYKPFTIKFALTLIQIIYNIVSKIQNQKFKMLHKHLNKSINKKSSKFDKSNNPINMH